jgi:hypothetical protein
VTVAEVAFLLFLIAGSGSRSRGCWRSGLTAASVAAASPPARQPPCSSQERQIEQSLACLEFCGYRRCPTLRSVSAQPLRTAYP